MKYRVSCWYRGGINMELAVTEVKVEPEEEDEKPEFKVVLNQCPWCHGICVEDTHVCAACEDDHESNCELKIETKLEPKSEESESDDKGAIETDPPGSAPDDLLGPEFARSPDVPASNQRTPRSRKRVTTGRETRSTTNRGAVANSNTDSSSDIEPAPTSSISRRLRLRKHKPSYKEYSKNQNEDSDSDYDPGDLGYSSDSGASIDFPAEKRPRLTCSARRAGLIVMNQSKNPKSTSTMLLKFDHREIDPKMMRQLNSARVVLNKISDPRLDSNELPSNNEKDYSASTTTHVSTSKTSAPQIVIVHPKQQHTSAATQTSPVPKPMLVNFNLSGAIPIASTGTRTKLRQTTTNSIGNILTHLNKAHENVIVLLQKPLQTPRVVVPNWYDLSADTDSINQKNLTSAPRPEKAPRQSILLDGTDTTKITKKRDEPEHRGSLLNLNQMNFKRLKPKSDTTSVRILPAKTSLQSQRAVVPNWSVLSADTDSINQKNFTLASRPERAPRQSSVLNGTDTTKVTKKRDEPEHRGRLLNLNRMTFRSLKPKSDTTSVRFLPTKTSLQSQRVVVPNWSVLSADTGNKKRSEPSASQRQAVLTSKQMRSVVLSSTAYVSGNASNHPKFAISSRLRTRKKIIHEVSSDEGNDSDCEIVEPNYICDTNPYSVNPKAHYKSMTTSSNLEKQWIRCKACGSRHTFSSLLDKEKFRDHIRHSHAIPWGERAKPGDRFFLCCECKSEWFTDLVSRVEHCEAKHPGHTHLQCQYQLSSFVEALKLEHCTSDIAVIKFMKSFMPSDQLNPSSRKKEVRNADRMFASQCPICSKKVFKITKHMQDHMRFLEKIKDKDMYVCTYCHLMFANLNVAVQHWVVTHYLRQELDSGQSIIDICKRLRGENTGRNISASANQSPMESNQTHVVRQDLMGQNNERGSCADRVPLSPFEVTSEGSGEVTKTFEDGNVCSIVLARSGNENIREFPGVHSTTESNETRGAMTEGSYRRVDALTEGSYRRGDVVTEGKGTSVRDMAEGNGIRRDAMIEGSETRSDTVTEGSDGTADAMTEGNTAREGAMTESSNARADTMTESSKARAHAMTEGSDARAHAMTEASDARVHAMTEGSDATADAMTEGNDAREDAMTESSNARADTMTESSMARAHAMTEFSDAREDPMTEGHEVRADALTEGIEARADAMTEGSEARVDAMTKSKGTSVDAMAEDNEARADAMTEGSEARADAMTGGSEARADTMTGGSEARVDAMTGGSEARADTMTGGSEARADAITGGSEARVDAMTKSKGTSVDTMAEDDEARVNSSIDGRETRGESVTDCSETREANMRGSEAVAVGKAEKVVFVVEKSTSKGEKDSDSRKDIDKDLKKAFIIEHKKMISNWEYIFSFFDALYPCQSCGTCFDRASKLLEHMKLKGECDQDTKPTCSACSKTFETYDDLQTHKKRHRKHIRLTRCEVCNKRLKSSRIRSHMRDAHNNKQPGGFVYVCEICGKGYNRRSTFRGHMNSHTGSKFKCAHCDATFNHLHSRYRHQKTHRDEVEKIKCSECPAEFSQRASLNRHMKIHQKLRYQCDICEKVYSQTHPLMQHRMKNHPGSHYIAPSQLLVKEEDTIDSSNIRKRRGGSSRKKHKRILDTADTTSQTAEGEQNANCSEFDSETQRRAESRGNVNDELDHA